MCIEKFTSSKSDKYLKKIRSITITQKIKSFIVKTVLFIYEKLNIRLVNFNTFN